MPDKTYKIVEVVGVSDQSIHQAVRNALKKATQTLRHLDWFEVENIRGAVNPKGDPEFQVTIKIGFRLEGDPVIFGTSASRQPAASLRLRKGGSRRVG